MARRPEVRRARRLARWLLVVVGLAAAAIVGALGLLYLRSPVQALNVANSMLLGDAGAVRAATGVRFTPDSGLALDVWTPPPDMRGPHPVLLFFYGGSWVDGRRQDYGFVAKAYATRGFVVVVPDYRKLPGGRFPAFMQDASDALGWTARNIARFGGDPARLAVGGHSVGAYIAAMLALDWRWPARAGLSPGIVRAGVGLAGPYDVYPFRWPPARAALGGARDPRDVQPLAVASRSAPPMWLATGTADTVVNPADTPRLASRLKAAGAADVVLRRYPGLGHSGVVMALSRPFRGLAPVLDESTAFLATRLAARPDRAMHMGGRYELRQVRGGAATSRQPL